MKGLLDKDLCITQLQSQGIKFDVNGLTAEPGMDIGGDKYLPVTDILRFTNGMSSAELETLMNAVETTQVLSVNTDQKTFASETDPNVSEKLVAALDTNKKTYRGLIVNGIETNPYTGEEVEEDASGDLPLAPTGHVVIALGNNYASTVLTGPDINVTMTDTFNVYDSNGQLVQSGSSSPQLTFNGLDALTVYTFTVYQVNSFGQSAAGFVVQFSTTA